MPADDPVAQSAELGRKLSDEDLRRVIEFLVAELRGRIRQAGQIAALSLRPGDEVESVKESRKLPQGTRGHVAEVRGSKVVVHFPDFGQWKMDATLVRKVPDSAESGAGSR
ncbi:MAG: hypothetical protein HY716_15770 [Planctomycetes bacterium]|nr:hypothetical protein [Planctomycetota bacterium]